MNRRRFLRRGLVAGAATSAGLAALTGGLYARRSYARTATAARLLDAALPPLAADAARALRTLPARAGDDLRRFFHGHCLNADGFAALVCSDPFADRVARCRTADEREACYLQAYCERVVGEAEIMGRLETAAHDVGRELDGDWAGYCELLAPAWSARLGSAGPPLVAGDLSADLEGRVRAELGEAVRQAVAAGHRPAVGETLGEIGASAVLLLPLVRFGKLGLAIGIPLFLLLAARPVWEFVTARLGDRRGGLRAEVSARLAAMGGLVAREFEREVGRRVGDLHAWREGAVRATAARLADERVGLI